YQNERNVINPFACELISLQKHAFACLTYPEFKKNPIWRLWFFYGKWKTLFRASSLNNSAVADFSTSLIRWSQFPLYANALQ
ncbi:hypothetical protein CWN68_23865, partial [Klebsiella michiganensis]